MQYLKINEENALFDLQPVSLGVSKNATIITVIESNISNATYGLHEKPINTGWKG